MQQIDVNSAVHSKEDQLFYSKYPTYYCYLLVSLMTKQNVVYLIMTSIAILLMNNCQ